MRQILARVLFVLSILSVSIGSSNENCVWNYKCCSFGEVNGQNSCVKMCEPEIKCEASDVETFKETDAEHEHEALRTVCRSGFHYYNGRCRRVFGRTREKIWDEIKISFIVYKTFWHFRHSTGFFFTDLLPEMVITEGTILIGMHKNILNKIRGSNIKAMGITETTLSRRENLFNFVVNNVLIIFGWSFNINFERK